MTKTEGPRHRERERDLFWGLKGFCSYLLVIWEIRNKQTNQKNRGKQRDWLTFGWLSRHGKLNFSLLTDVRAGSSNWMHLHLIQGKKIQRNCQNVIFTLEQIKTAQLMAFQSDIQIFTSTALRQLFGWTMRGKRFQILKMGFLQSEIKVS